MLSEIDNVANASSEGANGRAEISERLRDIMESSHSVLSRTLQATNSTEKLKKEIYKFKTQ